MKRHPFGSHGFGRETTVRLLGQHPPICCLRWHTEGGRLPQVIGKYFHAKALEGIARNLTQGIGLY